VCMYRYTAEYHCLQCLDAICDCVCGADSAALALRYDVSFLYARFDVFYLALRPAIIALFLILQSLMQREIESIIQSIKVSQTNTSNVGYTSIY